MNNFTVDKKIFDMFSDLKIGIIVCKNIDNTKNHNDINKLLNEVSNSAKKSLEGVELCEYPIIRQWRDAYKKFGEKKSRSSIESLIRSVVNGRDIPNINALVDIYNVISLKYFLPCGGEDIDRIDNDMELTLSNGKEIFLPLGSIEKENPNEGEVIYKFGDNVICRCFNYRESDITKLTEATTNAFLCIECIDKNDYSKLDQAVIELSDLIKKYLGGTSEIYFLDKDNNTIDF